MNKSESKLIEAFGRARFAQQLKKKGIDVNKMHSDNVKDAEAAKKRAASAQADLDSFRKKTGVTSESKDEFEPHMMYDPKTGKGTMAKVEADHIRMKKMGYSHDKPEVAESKTSLVDLKSMLGRNEATYKDTGWQKPKKDNMSAADGMNKAKELARKGQSLAKVAASGRTVPTIKPVKEAGLRPSFAKKVRNDTLNKDKGPAPTGKTTGPDDYDFLKYKNKKKPVSEVSDEMKARYIRGADASHRAARSNEREAIIANKPEKAKKFKDIMKKRNAGMTKAFGESLEDMASHSNKHLATILMNPRHPMHAAAKAERDRRAIR